MKMKINKKQIITGIVVVLVIGLVIGIGVAYNIYINRFIYNEEGALGNTTGNLYNDGKFCVYNGRVFFANPNDNNTLYSMKEDGSDLKKHNNDRTSFINISNGYIYYVRGNMPHAYLSIKLANGVCRLKIDAKDKVPVVIRRDISDSLLMCGNELFYRGYNTDGSYDSYKANTDGETGEKLLFEEGYQMLDYSDGKIYFANTKDDHNLMYYDLESKQTYQSVAGNFYMPDCEGDYIYYLDADNDRKLTRMTLMQRKPEVLAEDTVINYNYNPDRQEIYYQAENEDGNMLCKVNADGSDRQVIMKGNYNHINFTKEYVYFCEFNDEGTVYRMPLDGSSVPEIFSPGVIEEW